MDSTKPTTEEPAMPGFGIARDLRHLKTHGAASVAELREFLAQTRGRRPEEVLGLVAGSRLMRSVAMATLGAFVVLALGTVIPWSLKRWSGGAKSAARPSAPSQAAAAPQPKALQPEPLPAKPAAQATADAKPSPADAEKAIRVMGLGDTKVADPKTNPLEKSLDNLLDKIE